MKAVDSTALSQELLPDGVLPVFMSAHARGINIGDAPKNDECIGEFGVLLQVGCRGDPIITHRTLVVWMPGLDTRLDVLVGSAHGIGTIRIHFPLTAWWIVC